MTLPLQSITNFDDLLDFLRDELDWLVEDYQLDDLVFEYDADELGLKPEEAEKLSGGKIRQLRPMVGSQPFGIFFVEFGKKKLPIVVLRRILSQLVIKKRANAAESKRWDTADLIFISAFGEAEEREMAFAHFHKEPDSAELPILRVLGWDGSDTPLKLDYVERELKHRLNWPDDTDDQDAWREQWRSAFRHRPGHVINTASSLAETLAEFARRIRDAAATIIEHESEEKGHLRRLHRGFRDALIHDLTEEDFADTYAQTVTYGLLTAAVSRTDRGGDEGTALITENITDMVPVTNPFLKEMLEEFLKAGGRKGGIDFDELGIQDVVELLRDPKRTDLAAVLRDFGNKKQGEDPVIHFYEHFLAAYNKKLRIQRGVFYTPQPIVSYIVRSVHELLQAEFGLEDGLASTITWGEMLERNKDIKLPPLTDEAGETRTISSDEPFVQILDPATGTATFPVEVIDVIHKHLLKKWNESGGLAAMPKLQGIPKDATLPKTFDAYWQHYVPLGLLPRLYGYELLMAPYAIAHMKIGLKLHETGYKFGSNQRARIYLTNALEPKVKQLPQIGFDALAHEAEAVNEVKWYKRFTVVMGNPPYSDASQNMGEWTAPLIEPFRYYLRERIKERGAIRFEHCINNDYIKFWGLTLSLIAKTPFAVASLITSNTYLGGKSFRGVRDAMLRKVNRIDILDLHGEGWAGELAKQGISDENVFEITTGVSITTLIKSDQEMPEANVFHGEMTGSYREKSSALLEPKNQPVQTLITLELHHYRPFSPQGESDTEEYWRCPQVDTLFSASVDGIKTSRDGLVIATTREKSSEKIQAFARCNATINEIEDKFCVSAKRFDIRSVQHHLIKNFDEGLIYPILYRPFDIRYIYYDKELILSHRMNVMPSMFDKDAWSLVFASRLSAKGFDNVIACSTLCAHKCASHDINSRMFPVVGIFDSLLGMDSIMSNLNEASANLFPFPKEKEKPNSCQASRIGELVYAIVNAPSYRTRYYECISQDFPRIPIPINSELAHELAEKGKLLVKLHTLSAKPPEDVFTFSGSNSDVLVSPSWKNGVLAVGRLSEISDVEREIWEFKMCGYDVCKSWFSAGGKAGIQRKGERITQLYTTQLRTLLWSVRETLRIRREIDQVIEAHGGWPGAFETNPS